MLCSNASAKHKLPLVLINKSPLDQNKLPIYFQTSPRGWMTREIFESWFHIEFVPKVRSHLASINQEEKAVLLLDNCPNHPMKLETEDGKIRCVYLPVDSINLMPMLQGPVSYLKRKYRTNYLRTACMDSDFLKNQTTKKAAYSLANLWEEMPENLLKTCWHKMKLNLNIMCNLEPIDMQELRNNFNHLNLNLDETEINSWLDIDFDNPGYGFLTDSEIIEQVVNEKEHRAADTSLSI